MGIGIKDNTILSSVTIFENNFFGFFYRKIFVVLVNDGAAPDGV